MIVGELKQILETLDDSVPIFLSSDKMTDSFVIESTLKLAINGRCEDNAKCIGLLLNIKQQENLQNDDTK